MWAGGAQTPLLPRTSWKQEERREKKREEGSRKEKGDVPSKVQRSATVPGHTLVSLSSSITISTLWILTPTSFSASSNSPS